MSIGSQTPLVTIVAKGPVLICKLNRPTKKNALTHDMYTAMGDSLEELDSNTTLRALIFTGSGDSFTAGNDLADFTSAGEAHGETPVGRFLRLISSAAKPVIAAVNGLSIGVGVTMLLHCDFGYASPNAVFRMPFVDLGLVPEAASSMLVPQLVGHRRANELLLLGQSFSAAEATQMGFINAVVEGDVLAHATSIAEQLAVKAPSAVRRSKELLRTAPSSVAERMLVEGKLFGEQLRTPEFAEAAAAFMERRKPDFSKFA
jgi:enoyl-CoA hydratase/carnithine racemase